MKRDIRKKLLSQSGESIAETLVALLISALALMMLAGAIGAANRIITQSEKVMRNYYTANNIMIAGDASAKAGELTVSYGSVSLKDNIPYYNNAELSGTPIYMYTGE